MTIREIKPQLDEFMAAELSTGEKKKEKMKRFPHMRLDHQFFPEAKDWKVGEEYTVTLKIKMTGLSISKFNNDSEFNIIGVDMKQKK